MTNSRVFFSDLKSGKCSSTVEARMLRRWETKIAKRGGELKSVDMIMVDANGTIIPATISAKRVPSFLPRLTPGIMYAVSGFDVAPCGQTHRLTDTSLMIRFNDSTSLEVLTDPVSALPEEVFRLRNVTELLGLANSNSQLPDIVAELIAIKSTVSEPLKGKNHVMATIKLDDACPVILSLFDSQAITFHRRLESMSADPKVIVATNINPRMVGERLFLNATSATHIYFDAETNTGLACFNRLAATDTGFASPGPLLKEFAKVEHMTIAELNSFTPTTVSQDIEFMCTGRVARVNIMNGWCYVACYKCSRKLQRNESVFTCVRCENSHAAGDLRYQVELAVTDDNDECIFVCYDGVMTKLHGLQAHEAARLLMEEGANPAEPLIPSFITDMEGKRYTFQVKLTTYNFTATTQRFTITRIIDEHERLPLPNFVEHGGGEKGGSDMGGDNPIHLNAASCTSMLTTLEEADAQVVKQARVARVDKIDV